MSALTRLTELQLAMMLLTRLPAGPLGGEVPPLVAARWAFPVVGAGIGALVWGAHAAMVAHGAGPLLAATLALCALTLITGALHFDGLADFADGMGGGRDKAHALDIMRDSRIGSYGALAMILTVGLWVVSVAEAEPGLLAFIGAAALSRAGMVVLQEALPPARSDGMAHLAGGKSRAARAVVGVLLVAALVVAPIPVLVGAAVILAIGWQARRKLGGQTGDVLGAAQVASETAIWITLACL